MTSQIASCELNVALAVQSKLHNGNAAEISQALSNVLPTNSIKFWHMPLSFSWCSCLYISSQKKGQLIHYVCVVLTTIWVIYLYISVTQRINWYYQEIKTSRRQMTKLLNDFSKMKFLKNWGFQLPFFRILQFAALCMNYFANTL